jgi:hypothetical protein
MPGYVRIGAAVLAAVGVLLIVLGQTTVGVVDLLVVGVPVWGISTVRGFRSLRGDEPMAIPGDPITPRDAARLEMLDNFFSGGDSGGGGGDGGGGGGS